MQTSFSPTGGSQLTKAFFRWRTEWSNRDTDQRYFRFISVFLQRPLRYHFQITAARSGVVSICLSLHFQPSRAAPHPPPVSTPKFKFLHWVQRKLGDNCPAVKVTRGHAAAWSSFSDWLKSSVLASTHLSFWGSRPSRQEQPLSQML